MLLKNIYEYFHRGTTESEDKTYLCAIIDSGNDTLVAIGSHFLALRLISETMTDTVFVPSVKLTRDVENIMGSGIRAYPEWSWDNSIRVFKKTNPAIITEDLRERAIFVAKKVAAITHAIVTTNLQRGKIATGLFLQDVIYSEKKKQAQSLKDGNFDKQSMAKAPYVVQYADISRIPLQQAAEEILFRAQLDHEYLAKTEGVRLALFKKIKLAKTSNEIDTILTTYRETGVV